MTPDSHAPSQAEMCDGRIFRPGQRVSYFSTEFGALPGTLTEIDVTGPVTLFKVAIDEPEKLGRRDRYALNPIAAARHGHPDFDRLRDHGVSGGNLEILP